MRPRAPEPYLTYNMLVYARQMAALRRMAFERRVSVAALLRDMIEREIAA